LFFFVFFALFVVNLFFVFFASFAVNVALVSKVFYE